RIRELGSPTLIVQEGGYRTRTLGQNAAAFFTGLSDGAARGADRSPAVARRPTARRNHAGGQRSAATELRFRTTVRETDIGSIRSLVAATGFCTPEEVGIAAELLADRVEKGDRSDYRVLIAEAATADGDTGRVLGYSCFGPIPGTDRRYDLYWIAVAQDLQGQGLGRRILAETESRIVALGGERLYVDTSSSEKYAPTRAFYRRSGYTKAAEIPDFFRAGDGKVIFVKVLAVPA